MAYRWTQNRRWIAAGVATFAGLGCVVLAFLAIAFTHDPQADLPQEAELPQAGPGEYLGVDPDHYEYAEQAFESYPQAFSEVISDEGNARKNARIWLLTRKVSVPGKPAGEDFGCGPQKTGDCFEGDTMVLMADGTEKELKDIRIGEQVVTHTGAIRRVIDTFQKKYTGEMVTISVKGHSRPITATADHRFVWFPDCGYGRNSANGIKRDTSRMEWKEIGNLSIGERVLIPFGLNESPTESELIDFEELTGMRPDGYFVPESKRRLPHKTATIPEHFKGWKQPICGAVSVDVRLARLIGLYLAEGGASEHRVDFWFNRSEQFLAWETASLIESVFGVSAEINHQSSKPNVVNVRCHSVPVAAFFKAMIPGNVYSKEVPTCLFRAERAVRMAALRGWMDGDGHDRYDGITPVIIGVSASRPLAQSMEKLALSCGLKPSLTLRKKAAHQRVASSSLSIYGQYAAAIYPEWEHTTQKVKLCDRAKYGFALPVKSIERRPVVDETVYCITVEEEHSFVAEGYAVHNCVSWGWARCISECLASQIALGKANGGGVVFQPHQYGVCRRDGEMHGYRQIPCRSAGAIPSLAALNFDKFGLIFYHEVAADGVQYSGRLADQWGCTGVPAKWLTLGKQRNGGEAYPIRNLEELRDALCNGYPCSFAGAFSPGKKYAKDGRNCLLWNGEHLGYHQMCILAYDGSLGKGREYFFVQNSHGPSSTAATPPLSDEPPGGFWVEWKTMKAMLDNKGEIWACSAVAGFSKNDIDWSGFDQFRAAPINQENDDESLDEDRRASAARTARLLAL